MNKVLSSISDFGKKTWDDLVLKKALSITNEAVQIPLSIIDRTRVPFVSLNPVDPAQRARLKESMSAKGWMKTNPATVWRIRKGKKCTFILTDGFSRCAVAEELGLTTVWVVIRDYASEEDALKEARYQEFSRRHDDAKALFKHFEALNLEELRKEPGRLNERVGKLLNVSDKTAQKLIRISREATEETKDALREGKLSTDNAFHTLNTDTRKKSKPKAFFEGLDFALQSIADGKTPDEIRQAAEAL